MKKMGIKVMVLLALGLVIAGCAKKTEQTKILYPTAPDEPRFEWLATVASKADLYAPGFTSFLVGEDTSRAFSGPICVATTSDGRILVSDIYNRNVKFIDIETKEIGLFTQGTFGRNLGLAVDAQDQVYVADADVRKIMVYSSTGQPLKTIGGGELKKPAFLAVNDRLARLYVSDASDHAIKVFSLEGEFLFSFGQIGHEDGSFFSPQGLAIDREDRIFVADQQNARIQFFTAEGEFIDKFGTRGVNPDEFEAPKSLAFDSDGNLAVVDSRRPYFRVFDTDGTVLLVLGGAKASKHKLGFTAPSSVVVDRNDRYIITDLINRTVTVWQYYSEAFKARQSTQ